MALEHETPRLTPEQKDRVLDLAARLQAQHEAGIRVDDLAQAAAEAGIESRFVDQALRAVATEGQPHTYAPPPADQAETTTAMALMILLAVVNLAMCLTPMREIATTLFGFVPVAMAAAAAFFGTRGRLPGWTVPIFIVASYGLARGLGFALRKLAFMSSADYVRASVHIVFTVEFCAALVATLTVLAIRSVRRPSGLERPI